MKNLSEIQEHSQGSSMSSGVKLISEGVLYQRDENYKKEPTEILQLKNSRMSIFNYNVTRRKQVVFKDSIALPS